MATPSDFGPRLAVAPFFLLGERGDREDAIKVRSLPRPPNDGAVMHIVLPLWPPLPFVKRSVGSFNESPLHAVYRSVRTRV